MSKTSRILSRPSIAAGSVVLATIVPLASAANLRARTGIVPAASDILCNIVRGARIEDYLMTDRPFSIPVLWLCSLVIILFGAMVSFLPPHVDIERVRLMKAGSRAAYWAQRVLCTLGYVGCQVLWQGVLSVAIAAMLGGSLSLTVISPQAFEFFQAEEPISWGLEQAVQLIGIELVLLSIISLLAGFSAVLFGVPIALAAVLGYITIAIFTGWPVLVPNLLMAHRLTEYALLGVFGVHMVLGFLPLLAGLLVLFFRLRTIDFFI
ncbi:hypothetical protein K6V98_03450 [Collinsella sp. AGMB00827]|uniref:ABC transporter permease n=1 Tax=Collinsella ureilytica TaxID=2869515 RepID=A0ABS7MJF3_9ACTN|nr:hypothetical protein [Collinsella urealyticum]MBY4797417.1 hypothetical protein [Collinsella urealyticum]